VERDPDAEASFFDDGDENVTLIGRELRCGTVLLRRMKLLMCGIYLIHFERELGQQPLVMLPDDQSKKLTIRGLSCRGLDRVFQIDAESVVNVFRV
jgi:hypothetical protein